MPMHLVPVRCPELDPAQEIVVICHHGVRSLQVAMFLENRGFISVHNLTGGVNAWAAEVDQAMRRY
jgi:rhodanese-related sulfurtransferase